MASALIPVDERVVGGLTMRENKGEYYVLHLSFYLRVNLLTTYFSP